MSERVVMFTEERKPMYLEGFRNSTTHCRGRLMPGGYNVVLVKTPCSGYWHLFKEDSYQATQRRADNCLSSIQAKHVKVVHIPDTVMGDHYFMVKWAEARKGKA